MATLLRENNFRGCALVARGTRKSIFEMGEADSTDGRLNNRKLRYYLASVSKTFTAVLVLRTVQEGKMSLADPIRRFLPDLPAAYDSVSIRKLLLHTSGIPDYYGLLKVGPGFSNADVLKLLRKHSPRGKAEFSYSNSNYILLASALEQIHQKKFSELLRGKILQPSGALSTFARDEMSKLTGVASRHDENDHPVSYEFTTVGAGGLFSTVEDLYRVQKALLHGRLLTEKMRKEMWTPGVFISAKKVWYGYGWYINRERGEVYHDGNLLGSHTITYLMPEKGISIILLANHGPLQTVELARKIADILNEKP